MDLTKKKVYRNRQYLNWVATLPCSNCGIVDETIVAHHLIGVSQGKMGGKASDLETMPLCYDCHTEIHLFASSRKQQYKFISETLIRAIEVECEALNTISF